MAPKKRPAAAVASKFGSVQSRTIMSNPQFAPNRPQADLQACHLIAVKAKDKWIPKMASTFGQTLQFWNKHHCDAVNGIALTQNIHSAFDASAGVKVSFLPDLDKGNARKKQLKSKRFLFLRKPVPGNGLSIDDLFSKTSVEDIEEKSKKKSTGFLVKFHGGVQLLINRPAPQCFHKVSNFFEKTEKGKVQKDVCEMSNIKVVERALRLHSLDYKEGPKKQKALGLQARSLRLLGHEELHEELRDLPNGKHFSGDDFSEESTEEERSPADEDAQMDLLLRACRDSATLSGLSVEQSREPQKKRQKCSMPAAGGSVRPIGGGRAAAAAPRATRGRSRSRSPARDFRQAANPVGFPSVLIDIRPERSCPTFIEPEPEPGVGEDLDSRRSFNQKLQVITLLPQVGQVFLELGYLNGRNEIRRRQREAGAGHRPLGELIGLDSPEPAAGSGTR
eukprot:s2774_g9.t1